MKQKILAPGEAVGEWGGTIPYFGGVNDKPPIFFFQNEERFDLKPADMKRSIYEKTMERASKGTGAWTVSTPLMEALTRLIKFNDNINRIAAVLAANDVECDDLDAIGPVDAVDLSNHIEEVRVSAISYQLMNNKKLEYRNGKLLISSDSLSHGLSIFRKRKREYNRNGIAVTNRIAAAVLATNVLVCDDLDAICHADTVDLSNHREELIVSANSYHLMNNKGPEYRNGKLLISSDSFSHGLSIFRESKGEDNRNLTAVRNHIAAVLAANNVVCDDLDAICHADTVDWSNHIEEIIVSAISYHLMNKGPGYRNGKLLISSDGLSYGLSIFQESKGVGKMRLETNSESRKVHLSLKGRNCRLKPTNLLLLYLLGNFPLVSSLLVPPATNSIAASVNFTSNQVGAPLPTSSPSSLSGARLIVLIAGIALFMLIGVGVCGFFYGRRMRTEFQLPTTMSPSSDNIFSECNFTYQDIARATDNFSSAGLLGQGGFGFVHKGVLPPGKVIAVKQLKAGSSQGEREFQAEVKTISHVHHRHLVKLVGYCVYRDQRFLVYEFVSNGTLEFHLHGDGRPPMSCGARLKIAVGTAKGLAYLHEDCNPRIIHRDVKASNILIDDNFEAKVADFGLAKFFDDKYTHVSTKVAGTFGYMDPEYFFTGKLTEKSDVHSFGVLLLELITGRPPIDKAASSSNVSMIEWAMLALNSGNYDDLVDPNMTEYKPCEMARMIDCAAACVRTPARLRPQMSQVVRVLEGNQSVSTICAPGQG